jgi:two-component system phosphate regulon sensor histidine kinase PhoR
MQSADAGLPLAGPPAALPRELEAPRLNGSRVNWRRLRRVPGFALGLAVPSLLVLVGLWLTGRLDCRPALVAIVLVTALLALVVAPFARSLAALQEAIDAIGLNAGPEAEAAATRGLGSVGRTGDRLWQAVLRLARGWRERCQRAESGLAEAEAVFAAIPDPMILINRRRRVIRANPAAVEFVGAVPEASDLAVSLRNPIVLGAADAVLGGERTRVVDFAVSVPVERVMRARIARVQQGSYGGAAAILTLHDITALKASEQMRADFVANAGHELKTPLTSLVGFIETLLGAARDDPVARDRFLGIMRGEAGRMSRLVDDLLSLSRIELNEHVAPTNRVALAPLVEQVAEVLELRAAERGMHLELTLPETLPEVIGDEDELAQVFQNLIDNAIKYGRPNSTVAVAADCLGAAPGNGNGGLVRVAVKDQGDGIPNEHLPRLTERFYRVDNARSRALGGTGLGLAIVKHILNRHRGRLDISSTLGVGSTFTVGLHAAPQRSELVIER